ncbi:hypothetical protein [Pseudomonas aeruginosa]|uniref:hypothetical protein n=2 Tax=Pseudomonas aeruginosa TaxID=287 RepID=UPI0028D96060|nr:hypothetical protein [Pseudomonas aeruginosa]MDT8512345.1 hypothetical protein [Pseudomonas aeruginosa]MDT8543986.1 hypothetical protein [Pseudomonas aeruginosa]
MNKALAEQAGGDERAAFERAFTVQEGIYFDDKRGEYRSMNLCAIEASDAQDLNLQLQGWQARAALAQPSPMYDPKRCLACGGDHGNSGLPCPNMRVTAQAQPSPKCVKCGGTGEADSGGVHPWGEPVLIPCDCETEQAVAERPEVVAYADPVAFATFKERGHEGGVAGREWMWAEPGAALVAMSRTDECERIVGELRADRDSWAEQAEQRLADWDEMRKERDAALAEVERLRESKGDPSGSFDRCMKMMYERDEKAKQLEVALARVAELEMILRELNTSGLMQFSTADEEKAVRAALSGAQAQHSAGYAEARQCVNCRHIGINDSADYAACHDCNWTGPEPDEDKCPGCGSENCMAAACPECGGRYDLVAEANITAPAGQVPQAWLDVQAERRRQITAEGWTPEHDDLYCAAELPRAAAAYILNGANDEAPAIWSFSAKWWKPRDARSNYVRAGALILAEIERLDRAAPGKEVGHE